MKALRYVFVLAICFAMLPLQAQTRIMGKVLDKSNNEALPYVTVRILAADSTIVAGAIGGDDGTFALSVETPGSYLLSLGFYGWLPYYQTIEVTGAELSLGSLYMLPDTVTMLDAVEITAKAPLIEQKMDKLVMNVSQSAFAQGNNALELLRKAPGVSIDKDGNVLLNGQAVEVWIDGRPSHLDGKSLEALLRGTDGNSINKIEIIANPSAKYDAQGQGGIIDIKSKHTFAQGFNGSLSANAGGMGFGRNLELLGPDKAFYFTQDVNLNLNYRTTKTNTFLQLSESTMPMGVDVDNTTTSEHFTQMAQSYYDAQISSRTLKLGNDWFIDDKNTLGFIFTMPMSSMFQEADTDCNRSLQQIDGVATQKVNSYASTEFDNKQYMGNLNYTHIFNPQKMAELTANLDYMHNVQISDNVLANYYKFFPILAKDPSLLLHDNMTLHSNNFVDIYSAKVDYQSLVFGMFMMEAGAKWALSKTDNTLDRILGSTYASDSTNCEHTITPFDYNEHIGAAYATLATQIKHWSAKLGLRGEYTYAYNSTSTVKQNYFNLFPTAFVGYTSSDMKKRVNISYTRRIQRPNYAQLNPFRNYIDAHTANEGNPDLKPCFSNNFALTAGFGQYLTVYANYISNKDVISATPQIDITTGEQILKTDNFGRMEFIGGGFTLAEMPLGKAFSLLLSAGAYDVRNFAPTTPSLLVGVSNEDEPYESQSFLGTLYGCLTWNLPKDWKLQFDVQASTPITSGYIHVTSSFVSGISVKKTALDGRLIFNASFNDIFRTMSNDFSIIAAQGVTTTYNQQYLMQRVKVGLQWNFGAAQKPLRHRNVGNFDEAGRIGQVSAGANI